jgi:hypothetical protein
MTNPRTIGAVGRILATPRALAAWTLVAYAALSLFFAFLFWLLGDGSFSSRSASAGFRNLFDLAMPIVAVVLAVYIAPQVPLARVIALIAVLEYTVALFFGIVTLLIGLGAVLDHVGTPGDGLNALQYLVMGLAALALITVAGYISLRAYQSVGGRLPNMRMPGGPAAEKG